MNEADFEKWVEDSFMKIINGELETIKFPHTLSIQQREIIHHRAENCGLNTKSDGTRYRVLYLFKENREVQKQSSTQIISSQLQEASNVPLPSSQEVASVVSQPLATNTQSKVPCFVCGKLYAIGQGIRTHMSRMHKNEFKELKNTQ